MRPNRALRNASGFTIMIPLPSTSEFIGFPRKELLVVGFEDIGVRSQLY
jgi:hypothetical protein